MKINIDETYMKYSLYTIFTLSVMYIIFMLLSNLVLILKTSWMIISASISLLSPAIIALVITYLLHPLVSQIERLLKKVSNHHLRRTLSVLITYCFFIALIVLFIYGLYILVSGSLPRNLNLAGMMDSIAAYSQTYHELFARLTAYLQTSGISDGLKSQLLSMIQAVQTFISEAGTGIFVSLQKFGNNLINVTLGFIIAFYILKDYAYFKSLYRKMLSLMLHPRHERKLSGFLADIDGVVSSFIRGQLLAAMIVGALSSLALSLVGLDYAFFIGMTAGICNIIPYVGPLIGSVTAVIVALLGGNPLQALLAVAALIIVQQIDGNIVSPKIVGDSVGLHPIFIMISLIIGGSLFGLLGMIIAVPLAGIVKLMIIKLISASEKSHEIEDRS